MFYSCQAVEGRPSFDGESLTNIIQIQTIRLSDVLAIISAGSVHWVYYDHDQLPSPYEPKQQCEGISRTGISPGSGEFSGHVHGVNHTIK